MYSYIHAITCTNMFQYFRELLMKHDRLTQFLTDIVFSGLYTQR